MDANLGTAAVKKFISGYQAEYKSPPENAFAGLGYDTVKLLADAIKRAGSMDPKAIRTALQATSGLAGVTGTISFPSGSRIPQKGVTVWLCLCNARTKGLKPLGDVLVAHRLDLGMAKEPVRVEFILASSARRFPCFVTTSGLISARDASFSTKAR